MKRNLITGLVLTSLIGSAVTADDNVDEIYRYRSYVMSASQDHLKALKAYVEGELAIQGHVPAHVDSLLKLNDMYQDLFPTGPQHPESEALSLIWSDPSGFKQSILYNRKAIQVLGQVDPNDVKMLKRAVNEVRMTCNDCHYYYRER